MCCCNVATDTCFEQVLNITSPFWVRFYVVLTTFCCSAFCSQIQCPTCAFVDLAPEEKRRHMRLLYKLIFFLFSYMVANMCHARVTSSENRKIIKYYTLQRYPLPFWESIPFVHSRLSMWWKSATCYRNTSWSQTLVEWWNLYSILHRANLN